MSHDGYRYRFASHVPFEDVEASLLLAFWAAESLYGEARVRLECGHALDVTKRTCMIDAGSEVGRDVNKLFLGFLRREFGPGCFRVEPVNAAEKAPAFA